MPTEALLDVNVLIAAVFADHVAQTMAEALEKLRELTAAAGHVFLPDDAGLVTHLPAKLRFVEHDRRRRAARATAS